MVVAFVSHSFAQNDKCLKVSNDIIKDVKGKIISQSLSYDQNIYTIKVEVPATYDINMVKTACDSTNAKVVFDWKLNYDKNYEKTLLIGGKSMLIMYYPGDKVIYFEFPK